MLAIMAGNASTRVTDTCFTVSVLICIAVNNVKGPKVRGLDLLLNICQI